MGVRARGGEPEVERWREDQRKIISRLVNNVRRYGSLRPVNQGVLRPLGRAKMILQQLLRESRVTLIRFLERIKKIWDSAREC